MMIVECGASKLDRRNNSMTIQAKTLAGVDGQDAQDLGEVPVWGDVGEAGCPPIGTQALYDPDLHLITSFRNTAIAGVYGAMKTGDKAIFSSENCRAFWKEATREFTVMVKTDDGKDAILTLNGSAGKFQVTIKGVGFEMSEDGIKEFVPSGYRELTAAGTHILNGASVKLGQNPILAVAIGPQPGLVSTSVSASQ